MEELANIIKHPDILEMITIIKKIQNRMKDPDIKDLEYIQVYHILSKEFDDFFNKNTGIFVKIIKGENLKILASVLYYKDKVLRGLLSESELADKLATMYLPADLKKESDLKIKNLK